MSLSHILPDVQQLPAVKRLVEALRPHQAVATVDEVPFPFRPALIASLIAGIDRPVVVVSSRGDRSDALSTAINEFLPTDRQSRTWPAPEVLPFEQLPFDLSVATQRVTILDRLTHSTADGRAHV